MTRWKYNSWLYVNQNEATQPDVFQSRANNAMPRMSTATDGWQFHRRWVPACHVAIQTPRQTIASVAWLTSSPTNRRRRETGRCVSSLFSTIHVSDLALIDVDDVTNARVGSFRTGCVAEIHGRHFSTGNLTAAAAAACDRWPSCTLNSPDTLARTTMSDDVCIRLVFMLPAFERMKIYFYVKPPFRTEHLR